jgi:hypothetical protein
MNILDLLKNKKMKVMTDMKVEVELTIKEVKENHHSRDLEPATRENDWWPASHEWKNYTVTFTNGAQKTFDSIDQIKIVDS